MTRTLDPLPTTPRRFALLMVLFFASGAAALIYEVLWLKELGRLFGATAQSAAATLAVFFLGLSAGGWVWGRRSASMARPLRTYAWLELFIAVTACLYFGLLDVFRFTYAPLLATLGSRPWLVLLLKLLVATIVLFPPAFFMGGTLPVMAQFIVRKSDELGRRASLLYAINTLGATTGAFLAGFHLPRLLGYTGAYATGITINAFIAATAFTWSRERATPRPSPQRADVATRSTPLFLLTTAAVSGFATLGLEVLWTRMFAQVLQNSVYTFSAVLTVFLACLAIGSALANRLCRLRADPHIVLVTLLLSSGVLAALTPPVFHVLTSGLQAVGGDLGWNAYVLRVFITVGGVLVLPVVIMGSVFPYLMKVGESRMRSAGGTVGTLAAVNTAAAIFGSLMAGFVVLEHVGLWTGIRLLSGLYPILAIVLVPRGAAILRVAATLVAALVVAVFTWPHLTNVHLDPERNERLVQLRQGVHGTVAVVDAEGSLRLKVNNTYVLGSSLSYANQRLQSQIPLALHRDPRSVFYLGMGTGITAGGALAFPVERVVVCELNGGVIDASRACFAPWLEGLFNDDRVRVIEEDGRTFLATTRERFDVIIADIFLTYREGVGALYTREHFDTVRNRLAPGGLFAQWLTMFDLTEEEFGIIARTMIDTFPQVTLWRRGFSPSFPVFALVGHESVAPLDYSLVREWLQMLVDAGALPSDVWLSHIPLAAYAGNIGEAADLFDAYELSTDDRVPLEYRTPVTERESRGTDTAVLAWTALLDWESRLLLRVPPERDPFLSDVDADSERQVRAGEAFYGFETYRRLEQPEVAARYRARYEALLPGGIGSSDGDGPNGR